MICIGADNGISGSWGFISEYGTNQYSTPIKLDLNYQKTKVKHITRIDVVRLHELIWYELEEYWKKKFGNSATYSINVNQIIQEVRCMIERPMVNPTRFEATTSALRALEATLITLERLRIGYEYVDSKAWQKVLLPVVSKEQYSKDKQIYKKLSLEVGQRMFPHIEFGKDADGILIASYCQLRYKD